VLPLSLPAVSAAHAGCDCVVCLHLCFSCLRFVFFAPAAQEQQIVHTTATAAAETTT